MQWAQKSGMDWSAEPAVIQAGGLCCALDQRGGRFRPLRGPAPFATSGSTCSRDRDKDLARALEMNHSRTHREGPRIRPGVLSFVTPEVKKKSRRASGAKYPVMVHAAHWTIPMNRGQPRTRPESSSPIKVEEDKRV